MYFRAHHCSSHECSIVGFRRRGDLRRKLSISLLSNTGWRSTLRNIFYVLYGRNLEKGNKKKQDFVAVLQLLEVCFFVLSTPIFFLSFKTLSSKEPNLLPKIRADKEACPREGSVQQNKDTEDRETEIY